MEGCEVVIEAGKIDLGVRTVTPEEEDAGPTGVKEIRRGFFEGETSAATSSSGRLTGRLPIDDEACGASEFLSELDSKFNEMREVYKVGLS